jgi:hypothetical protein
MIDYDASWAVNPQFGGTRQAQGTVLLRLAHGQGRLSRVITARDRSAKS